MYIHIHTYIYIYTRTFISHYAILPSRKNSLTASRPRAKRDKTTAYSHHPARKPARLSKAKSTATGLTWRLMGVVFKFRA